MKISRKAQLWLADRYHALDKPSLYRRMPEPAQPIRPTVGAWDAMLIGLISLVMFLAGLFGLLIGLFMLTAFVVALIWG